eukprot:CCRYP_018851-RA/>CCRYP_018851-RA protein AED:0.03 eAED:0.03 QI:119/0.66/0.75/1/0.33/0.25/4/2232/247
MAINSLFSIAVLLLGAATCPATAFAPASHVALSSRSKGGMTLEMAAESEVSFDDLDGSALQIGVLRTRWNDDHVTNLVDGIKVKHFYFSKECRTQRVQSKRRKHLHQRSSGAYELPFAAKLLALSGTVDAIICCGVLIKGETLHFEYISEAVTKGIMDVNLSTMTPVVYGVLNCLNEDQVKKRSSSDNGGHNHGEDWAKTAVEMATMRREARGGKTKNLKELQAMGFGSKESGKEEEPSEKKERIFF